MSQARIEPISESERLWIDQNLELARAVARTYDAPELGDPPDPSALDAAFGSWLDAWHATPEAERHDPNRIINAFGAAIGTTLIARYGMAWGIYMDAQGNELVVHAQPNDFVTFPASSVAKRVEAREPGFIQPLVEMVGDEMDKNQSS